jgi:hypothetical protein
MQQQQPHAAEGKNVNSHHNKGKEWKWLENSEPYESEMSESLRYEE